ncbi:histidine-type phosphatase, partial [Bacteroides thetaiotaomicron]|nr:histidine-type phosphatase [Bacteroides thetaiotaomicron]
DAFLTRLMQDNPSLRIQRNEGRQYDDILRFFDLNKSYVNYNNNFACFLIYYVLVRNKMSTGSLITKRLIRPIIVRAM